MSRRNSDDDTEKPSMDLFANLMIVAFLALVAGCVFLALTLQQYDFKAAS